MSDFKGVSSAKYTAPAQVPQQAKSDAEALAPLHKLLATVHADSETAQLYPAASRTFEACLGVEGARLAKPIADAQAQLGPRQVRVLCAAFCQAQGGRSMDEAALARLFSFVGTLAAQLPGARSRDIAIGVCTPLSGPLLRTPHAKAFAEQLPRWQAQLPLEAGTVLLQALREELGERLLPPHEPPVKADTN